MRPRVELAPEQLHIEVMTEHMHVNVRCHEPQVEALLPWESFGCFVVL